MLRQLSLVTLQSAVQSIISAGTDAPCYDVAPMGQAAPYYLVETAGKRAEHTKTMFCDVVTFHVHCVAAQGEDYKNVYSMMQKAEEALTVEVCLPEGFSVLRQSEMKLVDLRQAENGETHAILAYEIKICYGFVVKN